MALDDTLAEVLASGAIKLIRAIYKQSTQPHLLRGRTSRPWARRADRRLPQAGRGGRLLRSNTRGIAAHIRLGDARSPGCDRRVPRQHAPLPKPPARRAYRGPRISALSRSGHGPTPRRRSLTRRSAVWATCTPRRWARRSRHKTIPKRPEGHEGVYNDRDYENRGGAAGDRRERRGDCARAALQGSRRRARSAAAKIIEIDGDGRAWRPLTCGRR